MATDSRTVTITVEIVHLDVDVLATLHQLNEGLTDGSHFIARVELVDGRLVVSYFRELPVARIPEFLRPTMEVKS